MRFVARVYLGQTCFAAFILPLDAVDVLELEENDEIARRQALDCRTGTPAANGLIEHKQNAGAHQ
ncbi:MAG: hypothetical protein WA855_01220 [Candidatus Acidiferrales bacterium]